MYNVYYMTKTQQSMYVYYALKIKLYIYVYAQVIKLFFQGKLIANKNK